MKYVIIYWDEGDDVHLLKNEYQETYKFDSEDKAESIACKHDLCSVYQVVRLNG